MRRPADNSDESGRDNAHAEGGDAELEVVVELLEAGLPLGSGLRALSEEAPSGRMRETLRRMSDELAAGRSPDEVFSRGGRGMPYFIGGLVRAGVQTGQLGVFLGEFLLAVRRRRATRLAYWLALAIPIVLLLLGVLVASAVLGFVMPHVKAIFLDIGVELPGFTVFVITLADILRPPVIIAFSSRYCFRRCSGMCCRRHSVRPPGHVSFRNCRSSALRRGCGGCLSSARFSACW